MSGFFEPPLFAAPYAEDDATIARRLLPQASLDPAREAGADRLARRLIGAIRAHPRGLGGVEDMLREYALTTPEGLALMTLAEALLRTPDAATADRLIEDKLGQGDFAQRETLSEGALVGASAWALGVSARVIQPGETPRGVLAQLTRRIGAPAVRAATRLAMGALGGHFVLGETIEAALRRAGAGSAQLERYSFDMLGEGARTASDAALYMDRYAEAIVKIGAQAVDGDRAIERPGISVKLSALHPRFEATNRTRALGELTPRLIELARLAKARNLDFTIDAEEADRLELSLETVGAARADASLRGWDGFGLAVQAYQKRALAVIGWAEDIAVAGGHFIPVRLVKGAYWDTEIKRAQERGLPDYPVFTRKAMTDLNYIACATRLLAARPRLYPRFATHNALTVASVLERAGGVEGYEFQRLHGMGGALYRELRDSFPAVACRVYAPVGGHRDLLAYLVRRLLENGANSSFVSAAADPRVPVETLLRRPHAQIAPETARHPNIPSPIDLYGATRRNSRGVEFGDRAALQGLLESIEAARGSVTAASIVDGRERATNDPQARVSPIDGALVGAAHWASEQEADDAMAAAARGFAAADPFDVETRACALERAADLIEARAPRFLHLLQVEAGKTLDDGVAEVREAADYCRYYAAEARRLRAAPRRLRGPTGESNTLLWRPRGVFVALSPWNFPLAIFVGQIAGALAASDAVVAKPAEQTPLIAYEAVRLLHEAGAPSAALHLVLGDGATGARLVAHPAVGGVVFTGSLETARAINQTLAQAPAILPLIAETGGVNAMIVDATALPEQVADDVVASAFRSAGQRCSALRLLCVQADVADRVVEMIVGAARERLVGDPRDIATDIGPVIDADAKARLDAWIVAMRAQARVRYAGEAHAGLYVAPHVIELPDAASLREEVFGPVLHVVRYRAQDLDTALDALAASGHQLTLGVHSRIEATVDRIRRRLPTGNIYINRNMIGAVVGVQPFGGSGLSGTGPKAGGPAYLARFMLEQTVSINTAAAGGDAALIGASEEAAPAAGVTREPASGD